MVITTAVALVVPLLVIVIVLLLASGAQPAIRQFGAQFVVSSAWNPVKQQFGAEPFIYGTLGSSSAPSPSSTARW
jgi:phosphate transport system permease protein